MNVGIATVVEFLQKKGHTVEANPNTKISEEQYAILVKEFSTDKNLRLESERFIQERQNKERNKASVSIEGFEKQPEKPKSEDVIKTVVPEDARPKFKPVGKIDLDKLNGRKPEKVEKEPEQKQEEPVVERPVVKPEVKKEPEKREPEVKEEEVVTPPVSVVEPTPVVVEPVVVPEPVVETKPVEVEKVVEEVKKEEPKVVVAAPVKAEEHKEEEKVETAQAEVTPVAEKAPEDDGVFKIRQPELGAKINVIGQIDLAALNQSTRPKKKSKEEKRREREEKEKIRQDQKKLMKEAIIKEIRKDDSKLAKSGPKDSAEAAANKKKRNRINKEKVDVNNVATSNFAAPRPNVQGKGGNSNGQGGQANGQGNNNRRNNNNKDRFKKPVIKQEVSEEDVAKQVKETLARLTTKGKNKTSKYRKEKREMASNRMQELEDQEMADSKVLKLTEFVTANELATMMDVSVNQVIATCMSIGIMVSINQRLDAETINLVAEEFGFKTEYVSAEVAQAIVEEEDAPEDLQPRAPIVTVMGHVDHGKTSLLDYIRKANVIAGEAGGITQHIGAYQIVTPKGDKITFIDTPGHEAFSEMRARGAKVTDIVVLVVAANDGIMPQTIEAIRHAQAAEVPIVVAINKIDLPGADPMKVKTALLQHGIAVEELGGESLCAEVSAKKRINIDKLLEAILLQAEILDLKANPNRTADGTVIEAKMEKGRGSVATVLVQRGTLKVGDICIAGKEWGRVRAMFNEMGHKVQEAGPATPVEVLGLQGTPAAGDDFTVVADENQAREVTNYRIRKERDAKLVKSAKSAMEQMLDKIKSGEIKHLPVIIKADVQGSIEAIEGTLNKLSNDEVSVQILHSAVGPISESDITLAKASNAFVIGFNVRAIPQARDMARRDGVDIRYYSIIYDVADDVKKGLEGMLSPELKEKILGYAEIRNVFNITGVGKVAGCMVTEGLVKRGAKVRLLRDNVVIHDGNLGQLKRFKEDVKEVKEGYECGMSFENYNDIQVGDFIECYEIEAIAAKL